MKRMSARGADTTPIGERLAGGRVEQARAALQAVAGSLGCPRAQLAVVRRAAPAASRRSCARIATSKPVGPHPRAAGSSSAR
jgi:hypothetical protein